jgi:hypothetical protein
MNFIVYCIHRYRALYSENPRVLWPLKAVHQLHTRICCRWKVNVKVKLPLCFFLKLSTTPRRRFVGSGGIAQRILDLSTSWRWIFMHRPLYPQGKSSCYPLDRRLGGPQSWSGRGGEERNSQPLPGLEPPIIQPVAQRYTNELSRLLFVVGNIPKICCVLCTFIYSKVQIWRRCRALRLCINKNKASGIYPIRNYALK